MKYTRTYSVYDHTSYSLGRLSANRHTHTPKAIPAVAAARIVDKIQHTIKKTFTLKKKLN